MLKHGEQPVKNYGYKAKERSKKINQSHRAVYCCGGDCTGDIAGALFDLVVMTTETDSAKATTVYGHKKTIKWLLVIAVGMFGFGFAMVPLYNLLCSVTGWNSIGTNSAQATTADISREIDLDRTVTVTFDGTINAGLPWEFKPLVRKLAVTPGKSYEANFYVKNYSDREIVGQAIPGVTPWQGTEHFHKTECFCFTQQTLAAGESRVMPLRFTVDADLPKDIKMLTLSYTLMDTDRSALKANAGLAKH